MSYDVIIVGAGISGLATAYALRQRKILLLEQKARVGGKVLSVMEGPYLLEAGPNSLMMGSMELWDLIRDLGIESEVVWPTRSSRVRYISDGSKMRSVTPLSLLGTMNSSSGLLKLLLGCRGKAPDETTVVYDFFCERIGRELTENLVVPFVSGVYAGNARKLMLHTAFPRLFQWGQSASLIRGALKGRTQEKRPEKRGIFSFRLGMETLIKALFRTLNDNQLGLEQTVSSMVKEGDGLWRVITDKSEYHTKHVIYCGDPSTFASMNLGPQYLRAQSLVEQVHLPWLGVIHLAFGKDSFKDSRRGFGFLRTQPKNNQDSILGCLWPAAMFSGRCPDDEELFTVFVGGSLFPHRAQDDEQEQVAAVLSELDRLLGLKKAPRFIRRIVWPASIPQYDLAHAKALTALRETGLSSSGLHICSNWTSGISVPDCIGKGLNLARSLDQIL